MMLIVCTSFLFMNEGLAIDGDVEYSAPYIMVDPETGQIVTVNPGPRLKAHETPEEMAAQETTQAGTTALSAAMSAGTLDNEELASPDTLPVIIAVLACLLMVVAGFTINYYKEKRGT
jgi:hypothetical protein